MEEWRKEVASSGLEGEDWDQGHWGGDTSQPASVFLMESNPESVEETIYSSIYPSIHPSIHPFYSSSLYSFPSFHLSNSQILDSDVPTYNMSDWVLSAETITDVYHKVPALKELTV